MLIVIQTSIRFRELFTMTKFSSQEELRKKKEKLTKLLQDMKVLTRDLDDFSEHRKFKKKIRHYENQIDKLDQKIN